MDKPKFKCQAQGPLGPMQCNEVQTWYFHTKEEYQESVDMNKGSWISLGKLEKVDAE